MRLPIQPNNELSICTNPRHPTFLQVFAVTNEMFLLSFKLLIDKLSSFPFLISEESFPIQQKPLSFQ